MTSSGVLTILETRIEGVVLMSTGQSVPGGEKEAKADLHLFLNGENMLMCGPTEVGMCERRVCVVKSAG
jgi:hypothetical protein